MTAKTTTILGVALLLAGLLAGLLPLSSQGAGCGSAFLKSRDASVSDLTAAIGGRFQDASATCADLRNIVRIPAVVLIVVGGGVFLVGRSNRRPGHRH